MEILNEVCDTTIHPFQLQFITILKDLWAFFDKHSANFIEFWNCPSDMNWQLCMSVDKETKKFNLIPLYPSKMLWDFNKREECDNIIKEWCMTFQTLDLKGRKFLNLLNDNLSNIKHFGFSNSLCAWATQAITNHAPIGEYQLRFFPREEFSCLCKSYPIESRCHIFYDCKWYNKYWNPMRDTIGQFVSFLEFNPNAFSFGESITWVGSFSAFLVVFHYSSFLFFSPFLLLLFFLFSPI